MLTKRSSVLNYLDGSWFVKAELSSDASGMGEATRRSNGLCM